MNKIIPIGEYLYMVDESEININDWGVHRNEKYRNEFPNDKNLLVKCTANNKDSIREHWIKVISSTNPDLGLPLLPLPDEQEDIERLGIDFANKIKMLAPIAEHEWLNAKDHFILGYKAAQGKGRYSEEDMKMAWESGATWMGEYNNPEPHRKKVPNWEEFLKSLKPVPIGCEIEIENGVVTKCKYYYE